MSNYLIMLNTSNWYCECCGYGTHFTISLYKDGVWQWSTSRDDQFGGVLNEETDENMGINAWEDFIKGMKRGLELAGHTVNLVEHIDQSEPHIDEEDGLL